MFLININIFIMSALSTSGAAAGEGVMVCCRVRPLGRGDRGDDRRMLRVLGDGRSLSAEIDAHRRLDFTYGRVFDESATNADIYTQIGRPLVASALDGIHGSILCYGQTGSGKTFTMMGRNGIFSEGDDAGLVPRVFTDIFEHVRVADKTAFDFEVRISVIEIYQDELFDMIPPSATAASSESAKKKEGSTSARQAKINASKKKIGIYETGGGAGLSVVGASSVEVLNAPAALKVADLALKRRRVAATEMNRESSRGHCVVLITIVKRDLVAATSKIGQLYAVDLAGSEAVGKTKVHGQQLSEAGMINKSLLTLGRVIKTLVEKSTLKKDAKSDSSDNGEEEKEMSQDEIGEEGGGGEDTEDEEDGDEEEKGEEEEGEKTKMEKKKKKKKKKKKATAKKKKTTTKKKKKKKTGAHLRIPYRDSNLTRLLQNSLGGNARCALCVNVSPSTFNASETLSTLRFAASTSKITNKPKRHEVQGVRQLKHLLAECQAMVTKNRTTLSVIEDEMQTFSDFFRLIRTSGLVLDDANDAEHSLMMHERVDVRRPRGIQQQTNTTNSKKEEEQDTQKSVSAESDVDGPAASLTVLRTASAGELSASLRVESQGYTEIHEDDHIAQARAALSWEEKDGEEEKDAQRPSAVEKEQVNIHLGAFLRTASLERESLDE